MSDATPALRTETEVNPWRDAALDLFERNGEALDELDGHAKAPATIRGYCNDWAGFAAWSQSQGVDLPECDGDTLDLVAPVPPMVVKAYIADRQHDLKSATITRHLSAIKHFHNEAGWVSPTDHPSVRKSLAGLTRKHKYTPRQAGPLRLYDLQPVLPDGDDVKAVRDRALLLWGFWSALRRSELVAMTVEAVEYLDAGAVFLIPFSKTDQTGAGARVAVNHQHSTVCDRVAECRGHAPCPVCALRRWLKVAGIKTGPIWRGVDRHGNVRDDALTAQSVSLILKDALEAAGANPAKYSAHSLRSGFVSTMDEHDVPRAAIRAVTRHKSEAVMDSYGRPDRLLRDSAGAWLSKSFGGDVSPLAEHDQRASYIADRAGR